MMLRKKKNVKMAKCKIIKIPSLKGEKKNLFPQKKKNTTTITIFSNI